MAGAGEIVMRTGLPCPEEVAQEKDDNENNHNDLEHTLGLQGDPTSPF